MLGQFLRPSLVELVKKKVRVKRYTSMNAAANFSQLRAWFETTSSVSNYFSLLFDMPSLVA